MNKRLERTQRVLDFLADAGYHIRSAEGYAEPGYDDPKGLVLFGDWNTPRFPHISGGEPLSKEESRIERGARILEALGNELEWDDEWTICADCCKAVRTNGYCWGWTPSYKEIDGECVCGGCLAADPDAYFAEIDGGGTHTIDSIDAEKHGYIRVVEGYERGLHPGMNDHPDAINEALEEKGVERWFYTIYPSQFSVSFDLWVHESEKDKMDFDAIKAGRGDPAAMLKRALSKVSNKPNTISHIDTETGEVTEESINW